MASTSLQRFPESADRPWSADLNTLMDVVLGNNGGRINLTGFDGTTYDPVTNAATTGLYALPVQAASGLHVDVINAAGSVHLLTVNDTSGVVMGGALSVTGDLTVDGRIVMTAAASKLVPGASTFAIRNNADSADNLQV